MTDDRTAIAVISEISGVQNTYLIFVKGATGATGGARVNFFWTV